MKTASRRPKGQNLEPTPPPAADAVDMALGAPRGMLIPVEQTPTDTTRGVDDSANLQDRITQRAYALYEARGCCEGHDLDDWLMAEQEVVGDLETPERDHQKREQR